MHRLLVALLAALDAVIAAVGGIAVVLAPLTLLWVVGLGTGADWAALWPAGGAIWQLGHLVPLAVTLPDEYLAATGIDPAAASFTLSLAPLALTVCTALFAARSARRAAQAGAPVTGAVAGTLVFAAMATAVALTTSNPVATVELWRAVLYPACIFGVPAVLTAIVEGWRGEERGAFARLRTAVERAPGAWGALPGLAVRGTAVAVAALVGVAGVVTAVAMVLGGAQAVALYQAANVDAVGAIVLALAQLAYLPTLLVWALAFVAGPGFALGAGSAVSPSGTQLGVIPGIPVLGAVPESSTPWLLLLALLPVGVGVLVGWMLRSRLAARPLARADDGGIGARVVLVLAVAVLTAAVAAMLAAVASGSIGPGLLAQLGVQPGPLALTVGLEILVGAAILLLLPRRDARAHGGAAASDRPSPAPEERGRPGDALWRRVSAPPMFVHDTHDVPRFDTPDPGAAETEPIPGLERGDGPATGGDPPAR